MAKRTGRNRGCTLVTHFAVDAPKSKVIKTLKLLGFSLVREREHIAMIRENAVSRLAQLGRDCLGT